MEAIERPIVLFLESLFNEQGGLSAVIATTIGSACILPAQRGENALGQLDVDAGQEALHT